MESKNEKKADQEERAATEWEPAGGKTPPETAEGQKREDQTEETDKKAAQAKRPEGHLPRPTFPLLLSTLASQVYIFLGDIANPLTGKREKDLPQAKYTIDMIQVLKDKTRGNVTEDEARMLETLLFELRMRYVNSTGK